MVEGKLRQASPAASKPAKRASEKGERLRVSHCVSGINEAHFDRWKALLFSLCMAVLIEKSASDFREHGILLANAESSCFDPSTDTYP